jgi:hypothetical protein
MTEGDEVDPAARAVAQADGDDRQHAVRPSELTTEELARIEAGTRAEITHRRITALEAELTALRGLRRSAIRQLVDAKISQNEVANRLGVTRARIGQIISGGPPPESAFLGNGPLTVALGGLSTVEVQELRKRTRGTGNYTMGEYIPIFEKLYPLAARMGRDCRFVQIGADGYVDVNRENLIVLCGPRHSALFRQLIGVNDPHLGFVEDGDVWHIEDKGTHESWHSPWDALPDRAIATSAGDHAYLGRIQRPNGSGGFLYIAGIHAIGTLGAVHFLAENSNLADLYAKVGENCFSAVVSCQAERESPTSSWSISATQLHSLAPHPQRKPED